MDQPKIDPLQIPLIICNIFEFLPFEEKKKWRALSRTFHDETLKSWSRAIVLTLDESLENQNGNVLNSETQVNGSKDPTEEMQFREVPISNLRLISERVFPEFIRKYLPDPRWDFALFLERSGFSLESLHIDATFRQYRFLDFLKLLLLKHCQNLKELSIRSYVILDMYPDQRFFDEDEEKNLPEVAEGLKSLALKFRNRIADSRAAEVQVCKGILSFVPNIKRLKVTGVELTKMITLLPHPLMSSVENAPPRFVRLKDLEIDGENDCDRELIVDGFRALRIYMKRVKPDLKRLRFINFSAETTRCPPYYVHQFISDCKFTLTRLQLNFVGSCHTPLSCWISDLTGTDFQSLTHLILVEEGKAEKSYRNYAPRFDFRALRGMKKLKVFRCIAKAMASPWGMPLQAEELEFKKEGEFEEFDWTRQVNARNKNVNLEREADPPLLEELEELSFFLRERLSAEAVRQLGKWMPSVRKLGLITDETLFPVLFEVWGKSLEKVVLLGPTNVTEELIEETTLGKTVQVQVLDNEECYEKFSEKIF